MSANGSDLGYWRGIQENIAALVKNAEEAAGIEPTQPLIIPAASSWAGQPPPPPRDWICEGLGLPATRVTSLLGNGGDGKTLIAEQLMVAVGTSTPLWGQPVAGGTVVGFFCEDEQAEVERKMRTICELDDIALDALDNVHPLSLDGENSVLCTFEHDGIVLSDFYHVIDATVAQYKPRLTIIDTAADVFAGDFVSTPHVRQFIKVALGGLCKRHDTAVLLLAHPSATAMASGQGGGFSVAWNNSVRSRLYLRRPKSDDPEDNADRRVLEIKKANYGRTGSTVPLLWDRGRFVVDPEPIDEAAPMNKRAAKTDTRLSIAALRYFQEHAASGQVVSFGTVMAALQVSGDLKPAAEGKGREAVRKQLQRTLKDLVAQHLLKLSDVPRGYRIVTEFTP